MFRRTVYGVLLSLLFVGMLTLALNIKPVKTEPRTIIVPDDYATIQEAINAANEGDAIYVKSGRYYENIVVNKSISLIGEDRQLTIIDAMGNGIALELTVDRILISNFTICNGDVGIHITSSHYHVIRNNLIENNTRGATGNYYTGTLYYGNIVRRNEYGIDFGHLGGPSSINNTALLNEIYDNFAGVYISAPEGNNTVKGNMIYGNNIGLVLDNTRNNNIVGNTFLNNTRSGGFNDGIYMRNAAVNNIQNNTFINNNVGIFMDRSSNNIIHNNSFVNNVYGTYLTINESLIFIGWSFNNVIVKNSFEKNSYGFHSDIGAAMFINSQFNTTFAENNMKNNSYGVHLSLADATISNNTFTNSDVGIHIELSGNSRVVNNIVVNCNTGLNVKLSGGSIISGNVVWNSSSIGINIDLSGGSTISNNKVSNSNVGIRLSLSGGCLINGNVIVNNDHGMDVSLSSDCMIYGNDFVNNIQQVATSLSSNKWNSTYPIGGNYWSDYNGVDLYSGPYQNITGSDGIGDSPYIISEDFFGKVNIDWYPLIKPLYVQSYQLIITTSIGGSTEPLPGTYYYVNGSQVTVTAIPQAGYSFDCWLLDGIKRTENPISILMDSNHTLHAVFIKVYSLTITATSGGITDPLPGTYTYTADSLVNVTAIPNLNYRFNYWLLDGVNAGSDNPISILMDANHTLQAVFTQITYQLTISTTPGGTTNPQPGTYTYINGTQVSVTALPNNGFSFNYWLLNGEVKVENPITIIMDKDHTLEAYFVDDVPPTTLDDYDGLWHNSDFTITLTAVDYGSGIAETYYRINNDPVKRVSVDGYPLITTEGANNTLEYWSVDNAGNEELHKFLSGIKLDKTSPLVTDHSRFPEDNVEPGQPIRITVNVTDNLSGVKEVILSYRVSSQSVWHNVTMTINQTTMLYEATIQIQQPNVNVEYRIISYDHAGNLIVEDNNGQYYVYTVIPEFPSTTILVSTIIFVMIISLLVKRRIPKKKHTNKSYSL